MKVQISDKEQWRIKEAEKYFQELGCETSVENLEVGDYVFDNKVCFEYKNMKDFIASIQDKRVFNESINQAESFDWHYVIIHGTEQDRAKEIAISKNYVPVDLFQYHGAIASINKYSTVIETYSPFLEESFYRMMIQAKKCLLNKPIVKKFPKKHKNTAFNFLCYTIYGINYKKAQAITEAYDLKNLHDLQVEGIGEKNAERIIAAIHG